MSQPETALSMEGYQPKPIVQKDNKMGTPVNKPSKDNTKVNIPPKKP